MDEAKTDYLDSELLSDAEGGGPKPPDRSGDNDELKTVRRPALGPPPSPPASQRPQPTSLPPASLPSTGEGRTRHTSEPAPGVGKPSWLRALLTTTFPPPVAPHPGARPPISAQTAGTVFAVLGLVFALLALVTGLRGAPSEPLAPAVAACLVIARAFVALGAGALSFAMFRQAERLLVDGSPAKS